MPGTTSSFGRKAAEAAITADWDSNQDGTQDWNRERGDSMKSGSGRSLGSGGSKTDVASTSTETSASGSGGQVETAKEAKESTRKATSWVKNIGMRTLRLRKNSENSRSKLSLPSNSSSLDRPMKSGKIKVSKKDSLDGDTSTIGSNQTHCSSGGNDEHVKLKNSRSGGASSNGSASREMGMGLPSTGENPDKQDPARFIGEGMSFKAKLIGVLEVSGPRGDRICQEALSELKMAVKAAGEHKQKITIHIALDGLRIRDEKTGDCLYHHQVHKISFIAQDLTDARAFGYIFGSPDTGHRFFGIKTEKSASQVVIAMRDLFQVVFDLKKKEIERAKQQLEMQQKFLATRAAETAPVKLEHKSSIAETYIEGACALGASSSPRTDAPEVDLLNLEVELNSLQEGLDNIHNNLVDSVPFRGSTASISSDPMNPLPKFSNLSVSSSSNTNTNNPTPVPTLTSDPFGDSFDPFESGIGASAVNVNVNTNSTSFSCKTFVGNHHQNSSSCNNSALTSPFATDPFAQVDPFPGPKFGEGEFFNSDPFDSPVTSFSFNFSNDMQTTTTSKAADNRFSCGNHANSNQQPQISEVSSNLTEKIPEPQREARPKFGDGWTASFEDNFVSEGMAAVEILNGPTTKDSIGSTSGLDIFTELDPLGTGRVKPFVDRKDFFQDLKNPPRKVLNDLCSDMPPTSSVVLAESGVTTTPAGPSATKVQIPDTVTIPNSFSTNFTPPPVVDFDSHFKTPSASSRSSLRVRLPSENSRSDSPPNYSPPPPPPHLSLHLSSTSATVVSNAEYFASNPPLLPPPSALNTPPSTRINKKSPQLLKQMTIASSSAGLNSSPKTLPRSGRLGKQFTVEVPLGEEIPNLIPPPRPPHASSGGTINKTASLTTAVPRPLSGSERLRKISGTLSSVPPEPPPRPLQTTTISTSSSTPLKFVSPPPPLPPKKQTVCPTQSNPIIGMLPGGKILYTNDSKHSHSNSLRSSVIESNDLPLPLPSRKSHTSSSSGSQNFSNTHTPIGRYAIPFTTPSLSGSPSVARREELSSASLSSSRSAHVVKLTMEQALYQVASLNLGELASKLELPVEKLSSLTIQQLAEMLTLMDFEKKVEEREKERKQKKYNMLQQQQGGFESNFEPGFEDDFSTASAPASIPVQKQSNFDKYAVFRELTVEDASGFSIVGKIGIGENDNEHESMNSDDDDQSKTLDKTITSKDSSSERTLQADGASILNTINANTMDDVTDANLSDDTKFPLDDDDEDVSFASNLNSKGEWATFESNFEDQFATTSLVKAVEDGEESPWDSDEGVKSQKTPVLPPGESQEFDFQPFQKPPQPQPVGALVGPLSAGTVGIGASPCRRGSREKEREQRHYELEPDPLRSPEGQFKRQSSGSSRHSERSIGGGGSGAVGKNSDYSDSGRPPLPPTRSRNNSQDIERWDLNRERDVSGRRERDRGREIRERERDNYSRSDSRNSYSSNPRKYRERGGPPGNSDDEYVPSNSLRRGRPRIGSARKALDRPTRGEYVEVEDEEEEDDRSYVSYHSNYSTTGHRKHRRYPPKYHYHTSSRSSRRGDVKPISSNISPERYSNHESDFDDSFGEENGGASVRKREYYQREREYVERHHRPRPTSCGAGVGKRYSRDSPRDYRDRHHRERERRRTGERDRDGEEDFDRELSDYSGEEEPSYHSHGHRRIRGRRNNHRDREVRDSRHYYYTNSPSWDSESGPEGSGKVDKPRQSYASRYTPCDEFGHVRDSPGSYNGGGGRQSYGPTGPRFHQSEMSLNSKSNNKLSEFRFDDDFSAANAAGGSISHGRQSSDPSNLVSGSGMHRSHEIDNFKEKVKQTKFPGSATAESITSMGDVPLDNKPPQPHSPFEDNFVTSTSPPQKQLCRTISDKSENGVSDDVDEEFENITEKSTECKNEIGDTKLETGEVFFPTKFEIEVGVDDKIEIERESASEAKPATSPPISTPPTTPLVFLRNNNKLEGFTLNNKRLESIRSEEERPEPNEEDDSPESTLNMKKSDSYNIFQQAKDPFADDDFFT